MAYVGSYGRGRPVTGGGIDAFEVSEDGSVLTHLHHVVRPKLAGHLVYCPVHHTLYAVDERKTDGRGPVQPAAGVHAFSVDPQDGSLSWLNAIPTPGCRPSHVSVLDSGRALFTANHGDVDHVERVVELPNGRWAVEYLYDDSTVVMLDLAENGKIDGIRDLKVLKGHGQDPCSSPQAGGHAQASPHAHCAVVDPSGEYLLVCDKSTGRIYVYRIGQKLALVSIYQASPCVGPRHLDFDPITRRVYIDYEFSSELSSFDFDQATGVLKLIDTVSTVDHRFEGLNEPAEVRAHPNGGFVYVNNRGEDSLAWFGVDPNGCLTRLGHVPLTPSVQPGLAARSFTLAPSGAFLLVADRAGDVISSYRVDPGDGSLELLTKVELADPAYIVFASL